jgi:hypothetical protein
MTTWRLYPGLYPGGIKLQGGTFYLEPGIYWLGGGGLDITGGSTITTSVATGTAGPLDFGVLFYNTSLPKSAPGPITLDGGSAKINLYPLDNGSKWDGLVIWQDKTVDLTVTINGSASASELRGTVYAPTAEVKVNGSGGTLTMDQIIAGTYVVDGKTRSTIKALNDDRFIFKVTAAGLVE